MNKMPQACTNPIAPRQTIDNTLTELDALVSRVYDATAALHETFSSVLEPSPANQETPVPPEGDSHVLPRLMRIMARLQQHDNDLRSIARECVL